VTTGGHDVVFNWGLWCGKTTEEKYLVAEGRRKEKKGSKRRTDGSGTLSTFMQTPSELSRLSGGVEKWSGE
jgi:hypothetical protein